MASGDTLVMAECRMAFFPSSNYPGQGTRNTHPTLLFDDTTSETCYFKFTMPRNYAGGNLVAYIHFSAVSATSGTGGWLLAFERIGDGSQDIDSDGFGSDQTVTAVTVPGTSGNVKIASLTITAGAATDSVAAGESFRFKVARDVTNDTAVGDLELHVIEIKEA